MGLLDRFKKPSGPDALTREAVARARVVPGVAAAEAVDADTVHVTWLQHPGTTVLSLADVRERWTGASGFDRIELMDGVVADLAPPPAGSVAPEAPEPVADAPAPLPEPPAEAVPAPAPAPAGADSGWSTARARLTVVVDRPGRGQGAVRWPVGPSLEARAVLDGPDGAAVGEAELDAWGVGPEEVRAAALENLAAIDPGLDPIGPGEPAWVPTAPASHPPAWLAAPERLLAASGLTAAVVLAPMATELVVVDPAAHELLGSVLAGTKAILAEQPDALLRAPLLVSAEQVTEWHPAPDHPCAPLVAELRAG